MMKKSLARGLSAALALLMTASTVSAATGTSAKAPFTSKVESAVIDAFQNPEEATDAKPMTRFWFPDSGAGLTDEDYTTYADVLTDSKYNSDYLTTVSDIIHELYDAGYGGVEITMLSDSASFKSNQAPVVGWGTKSWARIMAQALYTANHLGDGGEFKVDLTMTSHWPLVIDDIDPNDDQQQKGLVSADVTEVDADSLAEEEIKLNLPEEKTSDGDGATFLFKDELVSATLMKVTEDGKYDLDSAVVLDTTAEDAYPAGVPHEGYIVKKDGHWEEADASKVQTAEEDMVIDDDSNVLEGVEIKTRTIKVNQPPFGEMEQQQSYVVDADGNELTEGVNIITKGSQIMVEDGKVYSMSATSGIDSFNIEYGKEHGKTRDYMDDMQSYYYVDSADVKAAIGEDTEDEWVIVPVYARGTGQNKSGGQNQCMTYRTYTINYYTADGAYAVIDYWEQNLLDEAVSVYADNGTAVDTTLREMMKESGVSAIFEDSLELNLGSTSAAWSMDMLDSWSEYLGYDGAAYAGVLIDSSKYTGTVKTPETITTDYQALKSDLFNDAHCGIISQWSTATDASINDAVASGYKSYLAKYGLTANEAGNYGANAGGGYRFQSGSDDFKLSEDVDIVEGDNSSFGGDGLLNMMGTVNIKNDNGYASFEANTLTMSNTVFYGALMEFNRTASAGINRVVLHGVPFSTAFNDWVFVMGNSLSAWPGWNFMSYGCYDTRQAYYNDLYNEDGSVNEDADVYNFTEYITRVQALLQDTDEQINFLVVGDNTSTFSTALTDAGYHYNLTNEDGILYDSDVTAVSSIKNGVLNAGQHNIQAIVLNNIQSCKDVAFLNRLYAYAKKGLKILNLNSDISTVSGSENGKNTNANAAAKWAKLQKYVINIDSAEEVADYVTADISYSVSDELTGTTAKALKDKNTNEMFYFIWNGATTELNGKYGLDAFNSVYGEGGYAEMLKYEGVDQDLTVTVKADKNQIPYLLDAYTGEITKIADYTRNNDGTITLTTAIAGFDIAVLYVSADQDLTGNVQYQTEDTTSYDLTANTWDMDVYSYTENTEARVIDKDMTKVVELDTISMDGLQLWANFEQLSGVSGYAYYTTTFDYDGEADGAYIVVDHMANDTARCQDMITEVTVTNAEGKVTTFQQVNQESGKVDLGAALSKGTNTVQIKLVTTLAAVKSASGSFWGNNSNTNYGITGVKVTSYKYTGEAYQKMLKAQAAAKKAAALKAYKKLLKKVVSYSKKHHITLSCKNLKKLMALLSKLK